MNRAHRFVLLLLIALCVPAALCSGFADGEAPTRHLSKLKRGMTPDEVRHLMGAPNHIARQIFYHRYREQWLYNADVPVRLAFDCPRGQKPQLLSIQGVADSN